MKKLNHLNKEGKAEMVNIGNKSSTYREAVARTILKITPELLTILEKGEIKKGDVITVAKIAGINAAKKTAELIPMCHQILLENINLTFKYIKNPPQVRIQANVQCYSKTGVEMEALTAVSVAALSFYDMCKAVDKSIIIEKQGLYSKTGGKSGVFINSHLEW